MLSTIGSKPAQQPRVECGTCFGCAWRRLVTPCIISCGGACGKCGRPQRAGDGDGDGPVPLAGSEALLQRVYQAAGRVGRMAAVNREVHKPHYDTIIAEAAKSMS